MCARRASNVLAGASQCNRRVCCKTKPGGSFPKNAAGGIPGLHGGTRTSEDPSLGDVACDLNCKIIRCGPGNFRSVRTWYRSFHPGNSFTRSFAEGPLGERPPPFVIGRLEEAGATSHGESVRNGVMHSFPRMLSHSRLPRTEAEATGTSGPFVMRCVVCCAGFCCEFR